MFDDTFTDEIEYQEACIAAGLCPNCMYLLHKGPCAGTSDNLLRWGSVEDGGE